MVLIEETIIIFKHHSLCTQMVLRPAATIIQLCFTFETALSTTCCKVDVENKGSW